MKSVRKVRVKNNRNTMVGGNNIVIPSVTVTLTNDDDTINNNIIEQSTIFLDDVTNNNNQIVSDYASDDGGVDDAIDNNNFVCLINGSIDLNDIPVSSLGPKCRKKLSKNLNSIKVIPSEDGVPRDWRGVLNCLRLDTVSVGNLQSKYDPMEYLLDQWERESNETATLGQLQKILETIDRWDVVDDTSDLFSKKASFIVLFIYISCFIVISKHLIYEKSVTCHVSTKTHKNVRSHTIFNFISSFPSSTMIVTYS